MLLVWSRLSKQIQLSPTQYKIESQISIVNQLENKVDDLIKESDEVFKKSRSFEDEALKNVINALTTFKRIWTTELDKLTKMQEEFDSHIKPEPDDLIKYDKVFALRIPKQKEYPKEKLSEYALFIDKEGFKVDNIGKQKGYLIDLYCFFCVNK